MRVVGLDVHRDVRALVGGRDYAESQFNRAVNGMRQPGSAFKPIVYATAIAESIAANTIIPDTALAIRLPNRAVYRPSNSDGAFLGPITMREALTRSRNGAVHCHDCELTAASPWRARRITSPIEPYRPVPRASASPLDLGRCLRRLATLAPRRAALRHARRGRGDAVCRIASQDGDGADPTLRSLAT